jgi:hypothetical protein
MVKRGYILSFWLQIQRSRVRLPALPDFLRGSRSVMGSTQPREDNWGATWKCDTLDLDCACSCPSQSCVSLPVLRYSSVREVDCVSAVSPACELWEALSDVMLRLLCRTALFCVRRPSRGRERGQSWTVFAVSHVWAFACPPVSSCLASQ